LLVVTLIVGAFNLFMDPLARIHLFDIEGINDVKFNNGPLTRDYKAGHLFACTYDNFILGTSRSEMGIDPKSAYMFEGETYNTAFRASSAYETKLVGDYVLEHQQPKRLILGLDFISFSGKRQLPEEFYVSAINSERGLWDYARYLFSMETLQQSVLLLSWNLRFDIDRCSEDGANRQHERRVGANKAFMSIITRYVRNPQLYQGYEYSPELMGYIEEALIGFQDAGTDIHLFISPVHALHLEALHSSSLTEDLFLWKEELLLMLERVNARSGVTKSLSIWDFSGYNVINTEQIPEEPEKMAYFRDSAHYRKVVGDVILQRLQGKEMEPKFDGFGKKLTIESIRQDRELWPEQRARYQELDSRRVTEVHELARQANP